VSEYGKIVGVEKWQKKSIQQRGMEETPENGKKSTHSTHANGMNE
jgi:hypothetical protein